MAHRTKTQIATDFTTYWNDNTAGDITPADSRTVGGLMADSVMWGGTTQGDWHTSGGVGTGGFGFRNPALTYATTIVGGAVTADRTINLPVVTATDTFMTLGLGQNVTAMKRFNDATFSLRSSGNTVWHNLLSQQSGIPCNLYIPDSDGSASDYVMTSRADNLAIWGPKRFQPTTLRLANADDTFYATLNGGEQTANYTASLPVLSADVTIATTGANTFTGAQSLPVGSNVSVRYDFSKTYADLMADSGTVGLYDLPAGYAITHVGVYPSQAFTGGASATVNLQIGTSPSYDNVMSGFDLAVTASGSHFFFAEVNFAGSMTATTALSTTINNNGEDLTTGACTISLWITRFI